MIFQKSLKKRSQLRKVSNKITVENKSSVKARDKKPDNTKTVNVGSDGKEKVVVVQENADKNNHAVEEQKENEETLTSKAGNVSEKTSNEKGGNTDKLPQKITGKTVENSGNCETEKVELGEGNGQVGKKTKKAKSEKEEDIVGPCTQKEAWFVSGQIESPAGCPVN